MNLIFARHGQTDWNMKGIVQGSVDNPLNETGISQAKKLAELLKDRPIDIIISSTLIRAKQTAEIINQGRNLPIISDERVVERDFGIYEGKPTTEGDFNKIRYYTFNHPIPNGESMEEFVERIFNFIDSIKSEYANYENILVVCHGNVIRAVYWYINGFPTPPEKLVYFDNCEFLEFNT